VNEFTNGQRCWYAGRRVTIRSLRTADGRYLVEDGDVFFHASENSLTHLGMQRESVDRSTPFADIASRAAMVAKPKVKQKSKLR
jgi:hypothetical protein